MRTDSVTVRFWVVWVVWLLVIASGSTACAAWQRDASFPLQDVTDVQLVGSWLYFSSADTVYRRDALSHPTSRMGTLGESVTISRIFATGSRLIAGTYGAGVYESWDEGQTWAKTSAGLVGGGALSISDIASRGDSVYVGTSGAGIFVSSTIGSLNWQPYREGLPWNTAWEIYSLHCWEDLLLTGAGLSGYVYRNFRDSGNWEYFQFSDNVGNGLAMLAIGATETGMLVGLGSSGIYNSADSGATWQFFSTPFIAAEKGSVVLHPDRTLAVFSHTNRGIHIYEWRSDTWELLDTQTGLVAYDVVYFDGNLVAACWDGVWLYPIGSTGVDPGEPARPHSPGLSQNYPNPFNPETSIEYQLEKSSNVTLTIFNLLGQSIRTLVSRKEPAGLHKVTWDGLTSDGQPAAAGVYLYRLQAGDRSETKKMLLLK